MSAEPTISVVLPTYERREWVCRAVRSVFAQRYTDWELIVVDDGSTDGTEEALRPFAPRLRYLWQQNRGVSAARNAAVRLARGEIIAFLDSDDRWLPDHLETVVAMLERHPQAVLASTCPAYRISGRDPVQRARVESALPAIFFCNLVGHPSGVAVRREAMLAAGGFDERLEVGEDGEFFVRLALRGPFVSLQRRTIVRQSTSRSLRERGARRGSYPAAWRLMAARAVEAERCGESTLAEAEGPSRYVEAVVALLQGNRTAARSGFGEACAAWPELSRSPLLIYKRLENVLRDRDERLRVFSTAADVWPAPESDTALFFRTRALGLAVRLGRVATMARLVRGWPLRQTPGFLYRTRSFWTWLGRRYLQRRRHGAREKDL